jgi:hypothetical protein
LVAHQTPPVSKTIKKLPFLQLTLRLIGHFLSTKPLNVDHVAYQSCHILSLVKYDDINGDEMIDHRSCAGRDVDIFRIKLSNYSAVRATEIEFHSSMPESRLTVKISSGDHVTKVEYNALLPYDRIRFNFEKHILHDIILLEVSAEESNEYPKVKKIKFYEHILTDGVYDPYHQQSDMSSYKSNGYNSKHDNVTANIGQLLFMSPQPAEGEEMSKSVKQEQHASR